MEPNNNTSPPDRTKPATSPPPQTPPPQHRGGCRGEEGGCLHPLRAPQQHISRSFATTDPLPQLPPHCLPGLTGVAGRVGFWTRSIDQSASLARRWHRGSKGTKRNKRSREIQSSTAAVSRRFAEEHWSPGRRSDAGRICTETMFYPLKSEKVENPFIYFVLPIKKSA